MKIDLRQADYSIFLEVNHPCKTTVVPNIYITTCYV